VPGSSRSEEFSEPVKGRDVGSDMTAVREVPSDHVSVQCSSPGCSDPAVGPPGRYGDMFCYECVDF
jgi:hypothetical protein